MPLGNGVSACINLGFPYYTLEGPRGEPDDPLLETWTPLLFVMGEHAVQSKRDDIEDLRERLKAPTGLVVVGEAANEMMIREYLNS